MNKSVFDKWYELKELISENSNNITIVEYFLTNSCTHVYFGENADTQCIYIEFARDFLKDLSIPSFKGVDIYTSKEPQIKEDALFIKMVNNTNNEELFIAFTSSLCDLLKDCNSQMQVYEDILLIIKEYKDFFANKKTTLSKIEEQGLLCELIELKEIIIKLGEDAVFSWQGPNKNKRDFVFNNAAIEIKSTLSQINSSILISNENQLDQNFPNYLKNLFLIAYIVEEDANGFCIIDYIKDIVNLLTKCKNKSYFISNLLKLKINIYEYESNYNFTVQKTKYYKIDNNFPKLCKNNIPLGIFDVNYRIRLDDIIGNEISKEYIYGQL